MPITPKTGSLFHADSHSARVPVADGTVHSVVSQRSSRCSIGSRIDPWPAHGLDGCRLGRKPELHGHPVTRFEAADPQFQLRAAVPRRSGSRAASSCTTSTRPPHRRIPLHDDLRAALAALEAARGEKAGPNLPVIYSERADGYSSNAVAVWFQTGGSPSLASREHPRTRDGEPSSPPRQRRSPKPAAACATFKSWQAMARSRQPNDISRVTSRRSRKVIALL